LKNVKEDCIGKKDNQTVKWGIKAMTFDQWTKEVSKTVLPSMDESPQDLNKIFMLSDEDFEEEESPKS